MEKRMMHEGDELSRKKAKYEECESYFDFLSEPPTLVHAASVSIAIILWTEAGMRKFMQSQRQRLNSKVHFELEYCRLEERALKSVDELPLPKELKLSITHCMMPIGLQLQEAFDFSEVAYCRFYDLHKKGGVLYWNMEGVIDQVRSLQELISKDDRGKHSSYWYRLACKYCSEKDIMDVWNKIPPRKRMSVDDCCQNFQHHLLAYWAAFMKNELAGLLPKLLENDFLIHHQLYRPNLGLHENMVWLSISFGNSFALKYFWHKLSDHEKYANVEDWVDKIIGKIKRQKYINYQTCDIYTDMLWFLLAQVTDPEKQKHIFDAHSKTLLRSLLFYWPFQRFFLPAMIRLMNHIHIDIYAAIMKDLVLQIKDGRLTGEQFRTIWCHSPLKYQNHFLHVLSSGPKAKLFMMSSLLLAGDIQTICILLKNDSVEERQQFATNLIQYNLRRLIQSNKLAYADALLSKLWSDFDINSFKQNIMANYANEFCCDCLRKLNYTAAEQLLSWGFQSPSEIRDFKRNQLNLKEIFISLILLGDFDYVDRFFDWCLESQEEIKQFKEAFFSEDNIFYCEKLLFRLSSLSLDGWLVFERCIYYCNSSPKHEDVEKLKRLLLKEVGHIVEEHNLEFAWQLLHWCLGTKEEIDRFKKELLLSRRGIDAILKTMRDLPDWRKTKRLVKWFSPSKELVGKLKYTLTTKKFRSNRRIYSAFNQKSALFFLLDFFIKYYDNTDRTEWESVADRKLHSILMGD